VEGKNSSKQNKIGQLTVKIIHLKDMKILLNEDNHQIDLQEIIKNGNKTNFSY